MFTHDGLLQWGWQTLPCPLQARHALDLFTERCWHQPLSLPQHRMVADTHAKRSSEFTSGLTQVWLALDLLPQWSCKLFLFVCCFELGAGLDFLANRSGQCLGYHLGSLLFIILPFFTGGGAREEGVFKASHRVFVLIAVRLTL